MFHYGKYVSPIKIFRMQKTVKGFFTISMLLWCCKDENIRQAPFFIAMKARMDGSA